MKRSTFADSVEGGRETPFSPVAKLQLINSSCHVVKAWQLGRHNIIIKWGSWSMLLHKKQTFFHVRRVTWKPIMAGFGIKFSDGFLLSIWSGRMCFPFRLGCQVRIRSPPLPQVDRSSHHRCWRPTRQFPLQLSCNVSICPSYPVMFFRLDSCQLAMGGPSLTFRFPWDSWVAKVWALVIAGRCEAYRLYRLSYAARMFPGQQHLCVWQRGAIWERLLKVFDCLKLQPHHTITIQWHLMVVGKLTVTTCIVCCPTVQPWYRYPLHPFLNLEWFSDIQINNWFCLLPATASWNHCAFAPANSTWKLEAAPNTTNALAACGESGNNAAAKACGLYLLLIFFWGLL